MNLEKLTSIWEDLFLPLIDEYEPIEYILGEEIPAKSGYLDIRFIDIKFFFKYTDSVFRLGYEKIYIHEIRRVNKIMKVTFSYGNKV